MENEAVIRGLRRQPKTRTTGASFAVDPQSADSRAKQAAGRARILPEVSCESAMEQARAGPSDREGGLRAHRPGKQETRASGARFASGCDQHFQGQLPA